MNADGVPDQIEKVRRGLGAVRRSEGRGGAMDSEIPVPPDDDPTVAAHEKVVSSWQIPHALDEGAGGVILATEVDVVVDGGTFDVTRNSASDQQRFDLGSEQEGRAVEMVVERLYAQPVTGAEELLPVLVPDREGPHAIEAIDAAFAP